MGSIERNNNIEAGLTIYTALGNVTGEDIKEAIWDFYQKGPVTLDVLWDITRAELSELKREDIQGISQVPRKSLELRKGGKTAIVAPPDIAYGLSRMYQSSSEADKLPFTVKVFRDSQKARQWLAEINSRKK